jgi:hypothetical protein
MKYDRIQIDPVAFAGILPDGCSMYMKPELPKIEFKANKVTYKATDLRCLNETAVDCFIRILTEVCNNPDCEGVSFDVSGIEQDKIDLISDIVTGIDFSYHKGGKNGYSGSSVFLTSGTEYLESEEGATLTFTLIRDHARAIYEYAKGKSEIKYFEAIIAVHNATFQDILEVIT